MSAAAPVAGPPEGGSAAGQPRALQAHLDGFDLHANVCVPATDRAGLEQVCRYLLRPPVAQDRFRLTGDGCIRLALKTPWADGTRHLVFEPLEFLEKPAALIPRSRVNLVLYHGVLAPHARWRPRVVAAPSSDIIAPVTPNPPGSSAHKLNSPVQKDCQEEHEEDGQKGGGVVGSELAGPETARWSA